MLVSLYCQRFRSLLLFNLTTVSCFLQTNSVERGERDKRLVTANSVKLDGLSSIDLLQKFEEVKIRF